MDPVVPCIPGAWRSAWWGMDPVVPHRTWAQHGPRGGGSEGRDPSFAWIQKSHAQLGCGGDEGQGTWWNVDMVVSHRAGTWQGSRGGGPEGKGS